MDISTVFDEFSALLHAMLIELRRLADAMDQIAKAES